MTNSMLVRVIRGNSFYLELRALLQMLDKKPNYLTNINNPLFPISNTEVTYRVMNYWENNGLVDDCRDNQGKGWRKFSIVEVAWLEILKKLRIFGIPLEKLKNTKKSLFFRISKTKLRWIEWAYSRTSLDTGNTYLVVFEDGFAEVVSATEINFNNMIGQLSDAYIQINLNKLLKDTFNLKVMDDNNFVLSNDELYILSELRMGKSDEVIIKMAPNTREVKFIEKVFKNDKTNNAELNKIVSDIDYGEATVKIQNGKIVHIQAVKKEKTRGHSAHEN